MRCRPRRVSRRARPPPRASSGPARKAIEVPGGFRWSHRARGARLGVAVPAQPHGADAGQRAGKPPPADHRRSRQGTRRRCHDDDRGGVALAQHAGLEATGETVETTAGVWRTIASLARTPDAALIAMGARGWAARARPWRRSTAANGRPL